MTIKPMGYDFAGWATKNDIRCADGVVIRKDAFKAQDGKKVPLFWNHKHDSPSAVLGHAYLENRPEGVFAYGYFNNTQAGRDAREQLQHGDIESLSIWANNLTREDDNVYGGIVRELSLVPAGMNPGARIESVIAHGETLEEGEDEGIIYTGEPIQMGDSNIISHGQEEDMAKSIGDVLDTLSDEQKAAVGELFDSVYEHRDDYDDDYDEDDYDDDYDEDDDYEEDDEDMKHSIFNQDDNGYNEDEYLSHSAMKEIFDNAKRGGSLKQAFEDYTDGGELVHGTPSYSSAGMITAAPGAGYVKPAALDASAPGVKYGVYSTGSDGLNMLFPDYKSLNMPPEWIKRDMDWVSTVMTGVHHTPFSRIKSMYADITEDEARAKGYIKGKYKKEEFFTTLKRTTDPQTIYKKQRLDKDDIADITDFDVVSWIKGEMRMMLNEEIARAILIGDGRPSDHEDKIHENHIRPIVNDVPLFTVRVPINVQTGGATPSDLSEDVIAKNTINGAIRARKYYKGSGSPVFFTTEDVLTEMLLLEDGIGHKLYKTEAEVATAMRVSRIITVELMENYTVKFAESADTFPLIGVIVNLSDYNVGADKGGGVSMFDQFDIDYNQQKYLIETRMSGALIKPFSAMTLYRNKATS